MKTLFKYLKMSIIPVIITMFFLFFQAMCDLTLPEYTAKIVNVGIGQGGIEEKIPKYISKETFDELALFLTDEEYLELQSFYYENKTNGKYKIDNVYEIKDLNDLEEKKVYQLMSKPAIILLFVKSDSDFSLEIKNKLLTDSNINENVSLFDIIKNMGKENRLLLRESFDKKLEENSDLILEQSMISFIKDEYIKLGINVDELQTEYILKSGLTMLLISLISLVLAISVGFLGSRIAAKLARFLRSAVYQKVMSFSNTEFNKFKTSSLITRTTNDITQVQSLIVMLLRMVIYAPIMGVGGIIKVSNTNVSMTWIIVLAVSIIIVIMSFLFIFVIPKFSKIQEFLDKLNLTAREFLKGIPVIRAFTKEHHEEKRFDKANSDLKNLSLKVDRIMSLMMPLINFIMNGIVILIIWVAASKINIGSLQVGDMMALIQYIMQVIMSFIVIAMASIFLPRAIVSLKRIDEVLTTKEVIFDKEKVVEFSLEKEEKIEFKNVSFKYPDASENVLSDINFTAKKGKTTAFIGSTGSGKSTILNLLMRFYDVSAGEILIDGINIKDVKQEDLRKKISYVPQKGYLFSGTIASNLKLGNNNIKKEKLIEALDIAQAKDFVFEKNDNINFKISQAGTNVSGGQKQRLSIARALVKDSEILIFDDSFSALDFKTDKLLREALKEKMKDKTILIVAQRISTIMNAEQIIVLDNGKIVGSGTHQELLKTCKIYKEIAVSQLGGDFV